jgi:hypothetical protein
MFFSISLHIMLSLSYPLVLGVSHYICNQPLDLMRIHFFHCTYGGERILSYSSSKYKKYFH